MPRTDDASRTCFGSARSLSRNAHPDLLCAEATPASMRVRANALLTLRGVEVRGVLRFPIVAEPAVGERLLLSHLVESRHKPAPANGWSARRLSLRVWGSGLRIAVGRWV